MPWFSRKADQSLRPLEDCVAEKYSIRFYIGLCSVQEDSNIDEPLPNYRGVFLFLHLSIDISLIAKLF
jgi:hypothetical protein